MACIRNWALVMGKSWVWAVPSSGPAWYDRLADPFNYSILHRLKISSLFVHVFQLVQINGVCQGGILGPPNACLVSGGPNWTSAPNIYIFLYPLDFSPALVDKLKQATTWRCNVQASTVWICTCQHNVRVQLCLPICVKFPLFGDNRIILTLERLAL